MALIIGLFLKDYKDKYCKYNYNCNYNFKCCKFSFHYYDYLIISKLLLIKLVNSSPLSSP